ncbi:MAG: LamG domain-containing protein, partial [Planctomycetota bacterium]
MCRKLMLLSCLVTLLGLSNIAFADELFEIFKVDISCQQNSNGVKGEGWYDWYLVDGCRTEGDDRVRSLQKHEDVFDTGIDVEVGHPDTGYVSTRAGDGISNSTIHYSYQGGIDCGTVLLRLSNLSPETTYTVYTYHAWSDGYITSVTVAGADSNLVLNMPGVVDTDDDDYLLADNANKGVIEFTTDSIGSMVTITFGGCTRFNAFELWSDTPLPTASSPNPDGGTDVCPNDVQLSWTPGGNVNDVNGHDVYFGTDYDDVRDANRTNHPGLLYYSRGQDSNEYPEDGNPLLGLELMTTYYWRVDEVNDGNTWTGSIWSFTTEDGNARDPDPVVGFVGLSPDANVLSWTPSCVAASQDVYFSTDFSDVNEMKPGAKTTLSGTDNNIAPTLAKFTTYYWRIETTRSGDYSGTGATEVWRFSTGLGGLLLEMKFEGTKGTNLPCTVLDTSGNLLDFTNYSTHCDASANGEVKYDDGRRDGNSAVFDPCCGLYRQDTGESDPLRLAGWQYTIEMWAYVPSGVYPAENAWYMIVGKENGWKIMINDPGQDNDIRWYHRRGEKDYAIRAEGILPEIFDEWVHIAAVFDKTAQATQKLYIDAAIVASGSYQDTAAADNNTPVGIGVGVQNPPPFGFDRYFEGKIDELRIWDIVVEPEPEHATQPFPPDGSRGWEPNGVNDPNLDTFTWKPGKYAATVDGHNIYFGDSLDDVNESADPCEEGWDSNSWEHGKTFEIGKTYFWRVDEVNGLDVYPGHIWKFQMWADLIHPNIVVYYPLDETSGDDVPDYSGNYFNADCDDTPHWEPDNGRYGGCMHFSMEWEWDAYYEEWEWNVEPGNIEIESEYAGQMADMIDKEISICVWVNGDPNQSSDEDNVVFEFCDDDYDDKINGEPNDTKIVAIVPTKTGDVVFRAGVWPEDTLTWEGFDHMAARDTWHFFTFIKNDANMYIYLNTELVATQTDCNTTSLADVNGSGDAELELKLGAFVENDSGYHGRLDEFQIYNKALNELEIEKIFRGGELEPAWGPRPYNGQGNVSYDTDLTWKPGAYVADTNGHQVYFGTNWDDISDVNSSNYASYPNVEYSHQDACSYDP